MKSKHGLTNNIIFYNICLYLQVLLQVQLFLGLPFLLFLLWGRLHQDFRDFHDFWDVPDFRDFREILDFPEILTGGPGAQNLDAFAFAARELRTPPP